MNNTLSKNITSEVDGSQGNEHPYNESTEILLKIIKNNKIKKKFNEESNSSTTYG
jgi:hypothetical protein